MEQADIVDVRRIASEVRAFIEPLFPKRSAGSTDLSDSAGYCFCAADLLAHVLNNEAPGHGWISGEGVYISDEVMPMMRSGQLTSWSAIEDHTQFHGWVTSTVGIQIIVDITADQFGLAPVLVMSADAVEADNWAPRYFPTPDPDRLSEKWIGQWQAERNKLKSV
jgi:hypothetical protein